MHRIIAYKSLYVGMHFFPQFFYVGYQCSITISKILQLGNYHFKNPLNPNSNYKHLVIPSKIPTYINAVHILKWINVRNLNWRFSNASFTLSFLDKKIFPRTQSWILKGASEEFFMELFALWTAAILNKFFLRRMIHFRSLTKLCTT